jgi:hypothetical protein
LKAFRINHHILSTTNLPPVILARESEALKHHQNICHIITLAGPEKPAASFRKNHHY